MYLRKFFEPLVPEIKGIKDFEGQVLHTKFYRRPEPFKNQNVIILGFGPSAIEIGVEIAEVARVIRSPFERIGILINDIEITKK